MSQGATVVIRFKDIERNDEIREILEARCRHLSEDFPETLHYELWLTPDSNDISARARVSGKGIDLAAHASTGDLRAAAELAISRLRRELRRERDKRIFQPRRAAKKSAERNRAL